MSRADAGRIPRVDPLHPESWARDDLTGLPVMHTDMVKYYEWFADGLRWTGMLSHYKDVDQPNPQLCPPRLRPDPVPISNPRYAQLNEILTMPMNVVVSNITSTSAQISWNVIPGITQFSVMWEAIFGNNIIYPVNNPYTLSNLIPNSYYSISVASYQIQEVFIVGPNTSTINPAFSAYTDPISFTTS